MIHRYVSTACTHDRHPDCRVVCKFCEQICLCSCHWHVKATEHTEHVYQIERHRRQTDGKASAKSAQIAGEA